MDDSVRTGVFIACSVLKEELEALRVQYWPGWKSRYISSLLHMKPDLLARQLKPLILEETGHGHPVVLVYGDCCKDMASFQLIPGVARTAGMNCCELILGKEVYRKYLAAGVFFLLPEWTTRWKEVFVHELGLNQENASDLMHEMQSKLMYLDTGIVPVPIEEILACAKYCDLPYEILPVSLDHLKHQIQVAMDRLAAGEVLP
jgi:hypothetical protein